MSQNVTPGAQALPDCIILAELMAHRWSLKYTLELGAGGCFVCLDVVGGSGDGLGMPSRGCRRGPNMRERGC